MKNKILLAILCFFILPVVALAGGNNDDKVDTTSFCSYGQGTNGTNTLYIYINDGYKISYDYKGQTSTYFNVSLDIDVTNFLDSNNNLYCPSTIMSKMGTVSGRTTNLTFSFDASGPGYVSVNLLDSNIKQESVNTSKTVVQSCQYGEYSVVIYSDGSLQAFRSDYTVGITDEAGYFSNGTCASTVYAVDSNGRGGNFAGLHTSYVGQSVAISLNGTRTTTSRQFVNPETKTAKPGGEISGCESLFGDPGDKNYIAYWIQWLLDLIKYAGIIALLVLTTVDFIKAIVEHDQDAIKKAGVKSVKRFIYCVLLFFLPIIIDFVMSMFGAYGTCGIE